MLAQPAVTKILPRRRDFACPPETDLCPAVRRVETTLQRLESPAANGLMHGLGRDIQRLRQGRRQLGRLLILTSLFFLLAHSRLLLGCEGGSGASGLFMLACILVMHFLITRYTSHLATRRRIRTELLLLQKYASAHRIDLLIDVMRYGDGEASRLAQRLLVETLPQVREDCSLTRAHHAALCRVLHGTNANLILAVLAAFRTIGIPQSARAVQRMVSCPVWLADAQQIEKAAQVCYAAMQERADRQAMTATYLRAAAPDTGRVLLRPVPILTSVSFLQNTNERDVKQLVRAGAERERRPL